MQRSATSPLPQMCHFMFLIKKFSIAAVKNRCRIQSNNLSLLLNISLQKVIFGTKCILIIEIQITATHPDQRVCVCPRHKHSLNAYLLQTITAYFDD